MELGLQGAEIWDHTSQWASPAAPYEGMSAHWLLLGRLPLSITAIKTVITNLLYHCFAFLHSYRIAQRSKITILDRLKSNLEITEGALQSINSQIVSFDLCCSHSTRIMNRQVRMGCTLAAWRRWQPWREAGQPEHPAGWGLPSGYRPPLTCAAGSPPRRPAAGLQPAPDSAGLWGERLSWARPLTAGRGHGR